MVFVVKIHDACSSSGDIVVFADVAQATDYFGNPDWKINRDPPSYAPFTHHAEWSGADGEREGSEPYYLEGILLPFGKVVSCYE